MITYWKQTITSRGMKKALHHNTAAALLTEADKIAWINGILGHAERDHELVFLPSAQFYRTLKEPGGTEQAVDQLCRWLKIKTGKLHVKVVNKSRQAIGISHDKNGSMITIRADIAANPYQTAALLAYASVHKILNGQEQFQAMPPPEKLRYMDIATAYSGLGIVMLNGIRYERGWADRIWRSLKNIAFPGTYKLPVGSYQPSQYAELVLSHALEGRADLHEMAQYFLPWARPFLPARMHMLVKRRRDKLGYVLDADRSVRLNNLLAVLACMPLIALPLGQLIYNHVREPVPPPELISQREKVLTLLSMYETCTASVDRKRQVTDQTDLLTEGAVNAHANTCLSIKNRYNYELDQYRQALDLFRRTHGLPAQD